MLVVCSAVLLELFQVQPLYPRVVEVIARKIEALRVEQPQLKLMAWEDVKRLVKDEVNKLLSERQLCFVLKCLTDAGVVSHAYMLTVLSTFDLPFSLCILNKELSQILCSLTQDGSVKKSWEELLLQKAFLQLRLLLLVL